MKIMKKNLVALLLVAVTFTSFSYAGNIDPAGPPIMKMEFAKIFTSLAVQDHVNIVLTNSSESEITIEGEKRDIKDLRASVSHGCLTVWMANSVDGKKITVYVPAAFLDLIYVNGDSNVKSASALNNRQLTVEINGECRIDIRSQGKIELRDGFDYEFKRK